LQTHVWRSADGLHSVTLRIEGDDETDEHGEGHDLRSRQCSCDCCSGDDDHDEQGEDDDAFGFLRSMGHGLRVSPEIYEVEVEAQGDDGHLSGDLNRGQNVFFFGSPHAKGTSLRLDLPDFESMDRGQILEWARKLQNAPQFELPSAPALPILPHRPHVSRPHTHADRASEHIVIL